MCDILHIDMDAFYASIEEKDHPEYKNKPLVVVGDISERAVVCTANYSARKYNIFSAMPLKTALKKYPSLLVIKANFKKYQQISKQVYEILAKYTPEIEQASIDEFFIDVKGSHLLFGSSLSIAQNIKNDIKKKLNLTCSIGISFNKLLAKIASDLNKPDGITIINKKNVSQILDPLPVKKIPGIGPKTEKILQLKNINTIKDLKNLSLLSLKKTFGANGLYLYNAARGIGETKLSLSHKIKSISNEVTLEFDTMDKDIIKNVLLILSDKVGSRLKEDGLKGRTIKIKIKYYDFKTITKQLTLSKFTNLNEEIYKHSIELIQDLLTRPIRLIGIGISNLIKGEEQLNLFKTKATETKKYKFEQSLTLINKKFNKNILKRGSLL